MTRKTGSPYPSQHCRAEDQRFGNHGIKPVPAGTGLNCMALSCHTPVPTPDGWVRLKDIAPGQAVFDQRGMPCTVIAVCQREPEKVHRVEFDDESILLAGTHHPWVTVRHHLRHRIHGGRFALEDWASSRHPHHGGNRGLAGLPVGNPGGIHALGTGGQALEAA